MAPSFGPMQRPSLTCLTEESPGGSLGVGSPRPRRRSPRPAHESRRANHRVPEQRTVQHHVCRAGVSFISARLSPSFAFRPCLGGRFEVRGKADTEIPRSRLKLDAAFPRNNGDCFIILYIDKESTIRATSSPFPTRSAERKPSAVDTLLPPTRAPFIKSFTGSAGPLSSSRTPLHVRSTPPAPVEQDKPDTARRASGDSTASGQINRTAYPLKPEKSQLSPSISGSKSSVSFGLGQRPMSAVRELSGDF